MLQKYAHGIYLLLFLGCAGPAGPSDWMDVNTVAAVWENYPERIRYLFDAIDTEQAAFGPLKNELQAGDTVAAATWLVNY